MRKNYLTITSNDCNEHFNLFSKTKNEGFQPSSVMYVIHSFIHSIIIESQCYASHHFKCFSEIKLCQKHSLFIQEYID